MPFEKTCTTSFGRFRVKVNSTNIQVGGSKMCVTIAISPTKTELSWLGIENGGCALDYKIIQGSDTIRMVDLAFSLLRKYFPTRTVVTLLDDSGVYITDKSGKRIKVHFLSAYVLLYGKTWYEDKFGATMDNSDAYILYRQYIDTNFDNPLKKSDSFNFGSVNEELQPLYQSSTTWREFMNKIKENYPGKMKYKIISEWYRSAIKAILNIGIIPDWQIDITNRPVYECNPLEGGGRRGRLKTRKAKGKFPEYYPLEPFYQNKPID